MGERPILSRRGGHMSDTGLLLKSEAEPVRRLEVFTGAGRRRTWTAEQKTRIVAESYESGDPVSAVAKLGELINSRIMHRQGVSVSAIARQLAIDRKTVRTH